MKTKTKRPSKFATAVGRALRRAARVARKTARAHGTPIYIWKRLLRLSEDGFLDDSFRLQTPVSHYFAHMVLQPDGKVLLGGWSVDSSLQWTGLVSRISREGSVDPEFHRGLEV